MRADWAAISNEGFRRLAESERKIVAAALALAEGDPLVQRLEQFLAVRAMRYRNTPDIIIAIERMLEAKEGTADLVGIRAAQAALSLDASFVYDEVCDRLTTELPSTVVGPVEYWAMRFRSYGIGAALGVLLGGLGVDWQALVEGGEPLDELLAKALGLCG